MLAVRLRFVSLWLSQFSRPIADWGLRLLVVRQLVAESAGARNYGWHLATAVFIVPFILLAPVNGAISNGLPKRWVLVAACGISLFGVLLHGAVPGASLSCLAVVAACAAVYSPTRYALLPAAAQDTHWSLARINAFIEMGGAAGIMLGLLTAQLEQAQLIVLAAAGLALVAAMPVWFPSDVRRPEPPLLAIRDFFRDGRRILRDRQARICVFVLAGFLAVLSAGSGAVFMQLLDTESGLVERALPMLLTVGLGAAAGALLAGLQKHLYRGLGLVPIGSAGLMLSYASAILTGFSAWPWFFMGLTGGLVSVPLRAAYQAAVPPDARGNAMAVSNVVNYFAMAAMAGLLVLLVKLEIFTELSQQLLFLAVLGAVGTLILVWVLLRPLVEIITEIMFWPIYRVRASGPGLEGFPDRGPALVVANHACWFDPVLVGKVLPRRLFPMMTSVFFDLPFLRWMMVNVVQAIRVPAGGFRRDAPELLEAIALLDRGECVLIFPEGMMRRRDDQLIRQFGQGVWRILRDRPATPVVACWIEGAWGSYTSYRGGLPTKNKKLDRWWPIAVGVNAPQVLGPKLRDDHRATRAWLMRACLEARRHLNLDVPAEPTLPDEEPAEA